jgi:secondary thiamine-phosphate synthase enzyme
MAHCRMAMIETHKIEISTDGENDILNITDEIQRIVEQSELQDGTANLFLQSTTSGLTIIEWEKGILSDFRNAMERIAAKSGIYEHELAWHDGNGHSHVRSAIVGVTISLPFAKKKLLLGQWQQIVLAEFDVKPRRRSLIIQIHA